MEIKVSLYGKVVGYLTWDLRLDTSAFVYDDSFLRSSWQISPIYLPLESQVFRFPALRKDSFYGLPGGFADALPDDFGNTLINKYYLEKGTDIYSIKGTHRLAYMGDRAMGAFEFEPANYPFSLSKSLEWQQENIVDLANLAIQKENNIHFTIHDQQFLNLLQVGTSAGGMQPKILLAFDEDFQNIRSGQMTAPEGFRQCVLKITNATKASLEGRLEYVYYLMAVESGIKMSESHLVRFGESFHFVTERFDRKLNEKIHQSSASGLLHYSFRESENYSYGDLFMLSRYLEVSKEDQNQLYRMMCFNELMKNYDDHLKNFSFQLSKDGIWSLAPAYDLTYKYGNETTHHQLKINNKLRGITSQDLFVVGKQNEVKDFQEIYYQIREVAKQFRTFAKRHEVPTDVISFIESNLNLSDYTS